MIEDYPKNITSIISNIITHLVETWTFHSFYSTIRRRSKSPLWTLWTLSDISQNSQQKHGKTSSSRVAICIQITFLRLSPSLVESPDSFLRNFRRHETRWYWPRPGCLRLSKVTNRVERATINVPRPGDFRTIRRFARSGPARSRVDRSPPWKNWSPSLDTRRFFSRPERSYFRCCRATWNLAPFAPLLVSRIWNGNY